APLAPQAAAAACAARFGSAAPARGGSRRRDGRSSRRRRGEGGQARPRPRRAAGLRAAALRPGGRGGARALGRLGGARARQAVCRCRRPGRHPRGRRHRGNPSPVGAVSTENDPDLSISLKRSKLTEEQLKKREDERRAEAERQDKLLQTFRGWFSKLANEESTTEVRVEQLTLMKDSVVAEKALPNGITREDIVKGIRNIKYNIGCIKDKPKKDPDCKAVEKGYMQLLATIDKTYDRNIITR
ncbi:unnamed protein product, partial [Prorocentrum cordatum]